MSNPDQRDRAATIDADEVSRFAALAAEWWDPKGRLAPLHKLGPARLEFLRDQLCRRFARDPRRARPLAGLSLLDVGCGGGLVCEPLARLGARVVGIDPAPESIGAARQHAAAQGLAIDYRAARAEDLVAEGRTFDGVLCLEVIEHVPEPAAFLAICARLVAPGGLMLLSTINRTMKAYAFAIVGAEYVLRWLPAGTHQWERFVMPDELEAHVRKAGLEPHETRGVVYSPLSDRWSLSADTEVNYMLAAGRRA
jgi:2-polyprenyl-6-hydroxyphenyl methylase/3-demethylubiquinone-9 3-methyltransferase